MLDFASKSARWSAAAVALTLAVAPAHAGPFGDLGRHAAGVVAGAVTQEVVKEVAGDNSRETRTVAAVAGVAVAVGVSGDTSAGSIIGHSLGQAIIAGATSEWRDPHTGRRGRFHVVRSWRRHDPIRLRYYPSRVETIPPLEMMGGPYVAVKDVNMRGGPSTRYAKVGSLYRGEVVNVVGKVEGRSWYLISERGVGTGYVYANLLRPAAAGPAFGAASEPEAGPEPAPLEPAEEIAEETIAEGGDCREIEMTETNADGTSSTEVFTACETAEGWTVVDS